MTEAPKKRRPIWKILTVIAAVLGVLIGSAALWIRSTADRKYAVMEERVKALHAEANVPSKAPRPGAAPGNAWDDYLTALAEVQKLKTTDKLTGILARTQNADHAFGDAALKDHGSAVVDLVRGAGRIACVSPAFENYIKLWPYESLVQLALLKARKLKNEGRTSEAVEIRIALCQFGCDLGDSALLFASGPAQRTLREAFTELREDLNALSIPADVLATLDTRLTQLDDSFPRLQQARLQQLLFVGDGCLEMNQQPSWKTSILCWRFGFSSRLMACASFENWHHWLRKAMDADRLPWSEARSVMGRLRLEIQASYIPREFEFAPEFLDDGSTIRSARAHLRLLRTAAHYRRTGEVLDLEDPFGTRLLHQEGGGRLKVWSVGLDGVDQQGKGNWDSRVIEDIVLEVPR